MEVALGNGNGTQQQQEEKERDMYTMVSSQVPWGNRYVSDDATLLWLLGWKQMSDAKNAAGGNLASINPPQTLAYYGIIPEVNVYKTEPWNLLSESMQTPCMLQPYEMYFFTRRERLTGSRPARKAGRGTWRICGKPKSITGRDDGRGNSFVVGQKTLLSYDYDMRDDDEIAASRKRKRSKTSTDKKTTKTVWNMDEYTLGGDKNAAFQKLVLCRIKMSNRPENVRKMNDVYAKDLACHAASLCNDLDVAWY